MRGVLERVAAIGGLTLETMDWTSLRYEQITLIKTKAHRKWQGTSHREQDHVCSQGSCSRVLAHGVDGR